MKMQKLVIYVKKNLKVNILKIKNIVKLVTIVIVQVNCRGTAHSICSWKYSVPKEIPIVFHNGSNYDYYFILKQLVEEFEGKFTYLGENTVCYIIFSVPIEKEVTRIDKKGKEITKTLSYRLQFLNSARFMASLLSNLVSNLAEGIHKIKCKYGNNDKKCQTCGIKNKNWDYFLEYISFKGNFKKYKFICCNKNYQKQFGENLKKWFFNRYKFLNHDINKFILLLQKDIYPYQYMHR